MNAAPANPEKTRSKHKITRRVLLIWAGLAAVSLTFVPFVVFSILNVMPTDVVVFMCFYSVCPMFEKVWLFSALYFLIYFGIPAIASIAVAAFLDYIER